MQEDVHNDDDQLGDWLERPSIREWVDKEDIQRTRPPAFHSKERRALLASIKSDEGSLSEAFQQLKLLDGTNANDISIRVDSIKESLTQKRVRCSPIQLLPPQLLIIIFLMVFPDGIPLDPQCKPPHRLFEVCNEWRTLAFCTPELWCTIRIPDYLTPDDGASALLETSLLRWLDLSRSRPLTIEVPFLVTYPFNIHCWEILLDHIGRWKVLTLDFFDFEISPISFVCQILLSVWELSDKCTSLDTLEIVLGPDYRDGIYDNAIEPLPTARFPQLRQLELWWEATSLVEKIDGFSITRLNYYYAPVTLFDTEMIIENLPNLKSAHFFHCYIVGFHEEDSAFPLPVLRHDKLEHCQILTIRPLRNFQFLAQCPRLTLLAMYNSIDMRTHNITAPKVFPPHILHLHLAAPFDLSTEETMDFFERFPSLFSLRLFQKSIYVKKIDETVDDTEDAIEAILNAFLFYSEDEDPLCPELRYFNITSLRVDINQLLYFSEQRQGFIDQVLRFPYSFRVSLSGCAGLPNLEEADFFYLTFGAPALHEESASGNINNLPHSMPRSESI